MLRGATVVVVGTAVELAVVAGVMVDVVGDAVVVATVVVTTGVRLETGEALGFVSGVPPAQAATTRSREASCRRTAAR